MQRVRARLRRVALRERERRWDARQLKRKRQIEYAAMGGGADLTLQDTCICMLQVSTEKIQEYDCAVDPNWDTQLENWEVSITPAPLPHPAPSPRPFHIHRARRPLPQPLLARGRPCDRRSAIWPRSRGAPSAWGAIGAAAARATCSSAATPPWRSTTTRLSTRLSTTTTTAATGSTEGFFSSATCEMTRRPPAADPPGRAAPADNVEGEV